MSMHDWTSVPSAIYHAFHHEWISRSLNRGILPEGFYALPEQQTAGFGPDVLALQERTASRGDSETGGGVATLNRPKTRFTALSDEEFYRRKKSWIAVKHVSGDRTVAIVDIVSPGNKKNKKHFDAFIDKACELLELKINLLIADRFPPSSRDPNGIHAAIWNEVLEDSFTLPVDKPLTIVSYESNVKARAYIETIAVGDRLPDMPLFLARDEWVTVPLEATYNGTFDAVPKRWRDVLLNPGPEVLESADSSFSPDD